MEVMRAHQESLMTIVQVLLHDPLSAWTLSPQRAYALQGRRERRDCDTADLNVSLAGNADPDPDVDGDKPGRGRGRGVPSPSSCVQISHGHVKVFEVVIHDELSSILGFDFGSHTAFLMTQVCLVR